MKLLRSLVKQPVAHSVSSMKKVDLGACRKEKTEIEVIEAYLRRQLLARVRSRSGRRP